MVRRLPASMKENDFLESVSPLPDYDYFHFAEADQTLAQYGLGRYINAFAYCKILLLILDNLCWMNSFMKQFLII